MPEVPSLVTLCIRAIKDAILDENGNLPYVYKLPSELFERLLPHLPPLALQNLQEAMPSVSSNEYWSSDDCLRPSRKRKRLDNFDIAWEALYKLRWAVVPKSVDLLPEDVQQDEATTNWQQIYWEKHLQNCLDAAAEMVAITLFDGYLGEVEISDALLKCITYEGNRIRSRSYLKLSYHCERFGQYARSLRLQSIHCVAEIGHLLRKSQLKYLETHWIKSKVQVDGICKLLEQNKETLEKLELVHCKLRASYITAICNSLHMKGFETNVIKSFSIKRSSFLDGSDYPLPMGLESLLTAARSGLTSLVLSDNHLWWKTARGVLETLLDADSSLQVLDLSDNNIAGWLSNYKWNSIKSHGLNDKSLKSLRVLNLRSNNFQKDDADCLKYATTSMPNLEVLNLSDNPLQDDGISSLVPYLVEKSKCDTPLTELYLENCDLSYNGASNLLKVLSALNVQLKSLSIANNHLTSKFGTPLGKFLRSNIQVLDVRGIGLGASGFSDAQQEIVEQKLSLVMINISNNHGGVRTANFLSKLISQALNLVSVDASNNFIPVEALSVICSSLKAANGRLEHLDLTRNPLCNKPKIVSLLAEFQINGKPNIFLSPPIAPPVAIPVAIYDHDP